MTNVLAPASSRPVVRVRVVPTVRSAWRLSPFALLSVSALSCVTLDGIAMPAPAPVTVSDDAGPPIRLVAVPAMALLIVSRCAPRLSWPEASVSVPETVRLPVMATPRASATTRLYKGVVTEPPIVWPANPFIVTVLVPGTIVPLSVRLPPIATELAFARNVPVTRRLPTIVRL